MSLLDAPWRVKNEVRRLLSLPWIRLHFAVHGIAWGKGWRIYGAPVLQRHRGSSIVLGDHLDLRSWYGTNPLAANHPVVFATRTAEAVIQVGQHSGFTGATIVAAESVRIGSWVAVGANSTITDTDYHPLNPDERRHNILNGRHAPVVIEDDVFIGMNSLILKGVTLGRACVIGAGSVVTRDVPPGTIAAGSPARVLGVVPAWDGKQRK